MAIGKAQWQRRLKAALEATGQEMKDLPDEWEGFAKRAPQRAAHDSDTFSASEPLARSVADYFGFPVEWFTVKDFPAWISGAGRLRPGESGELGFLLRRIDQGVTALATDAGLAEQLQRSEPTPRPHTESTQEGSGSD